MFIHEVSGPDHYWRGCCRFNVRHHGSTSWQTCAGTGALQQGGQENPDVGRWALNFTNLHVTPESYFSANPHFCKSALSRYTQWDFIDLVKQHGIGYFEKETVNGLSGQLFCNQSSKLILAMLLEECRQGGVEIKLNCEIETVIHPAACWDLKRVAVERPLARLKPQLTVLPGNQPGLFQVRNTGGGGRWFVCTQSWWVRYW